MIADTNPIRSAWACKFEKLDSRGHDNSVPCSPLGPQGTSQVEPKGHESNSSPCSIICCSWPWRREGRSVLLVYEQNRKTPCKRGQIAGFALDLWHLAWSPRGVAQAPTSLRRGVRIAREGPYAGDVPARHQDRSHLVQVVGNDATTL